MKKIFILLGIIMMSVVFAGCSSSGVKIKGLNSEEQKLVSSLKGDQKLNDAAALAAVFAGKESSMELERQIYNKINEISKAHPEYKIGKNNKEASEFVPELSNKWERRAKYIVPSLIIRTYLEQNPCSDSLPFTKSMVIDLGKKRNFESITIEDQKGQPSIVLSQFDTTIKAPSSATAIDSVENLLTNKWEETSNTQGKQTTGESYSAHLNQDKLYFVSLSKKYNYNRYVKPGLSEGQKVDAGRKIAITALKNAKLDQDLMIRMSFTENGCQRIKEHIENLTDADLGSIKRYGDYEYININLEGKQISLIISPAIMVDDNIYRKNPMSVGWLFVGIKTKYSKRIEKDISLIADIYNASKDTKPKAAKEIELNSSNEQTLEGAKDVLKGSFDTKVNISTNVGYISGTEVRMRNAAGYDSEVINEFDKGEEVRVLEQAKVWTKVQRRDGTVGWVHSDYCSRMPTTN